MYLTKEAAQKAASQLAQEADRQRETYLDDPDNPCADYHAERAKWAKEKAEEAERIAKEFDECHDPQ